MLTACLCVLPLRAARVSVDAQLDSMQMLIGCQNRYRLTVTVPEESQVEIPVIYADTLVKGVEILSRSGPDSAQIGNGRKQYTLDYLLTSFDQDLYYLPPVTVKADGEEYESNYLSLKVMTYQVDTTSMQIFDVKPILKAPFVILDWLWPWGLIPLVGCLACVAVLLISRFRRKQEEESVSDPELLLPPHVAAIQALDAIREAKIWQQGRYKDFYTQLTDVLRRYISRRFGISAMEMTSDEVLDLLRREPEAKPVYREMCQILQLADLVKFAKMNPLPDENDRSLKQAYQFVDQTKMEETQEDVSGKEAGL